MDPTVFTMRKMLVGQKQQLYLQDHFSGLRLAHGAVTVIGSTGVHAHSIVVGCCYENRALRVHHPTWILDRWMRRERDNDSRFFEKLKNLL